MAHPTEANPTPSAPRPSGGERLGRRVAIVLFYGMVGAFCIGATVQITQQVFFLGDGAMPYATCEEGLRALVQGVFRAREAASGMEGEEESLGTFRGALRPEWDHHDAVARRCQENASQQRALDAIERLRYAEEHAVRRGAGDLAPLRRRVQNLLETQLAASP